MTDRASIANTPTKDAAKQTTVKAEHLCREFGDFVAVDDVSFSVAAGEVFGFLGSNGAGKTTTIRMLCGLLAPTAGTAQVAGFDVASQSNRIKEHIGYMSQRFSLYGDLTVRENLSFWAATYGLSRRERRKRRAWALDITGLQGQTNRLVRDLPGGYRQRLALACALMHRPPVVFLDEPTGGVDPRARRSFWDLIDSLAEADTTVFVTTHYMDEAERCHRVALMHAGKLLAIDTVPNLKRRYARNDMFELDCARPAAAVRKMAQLDTLADATLFGNKIHVEVGQARHIDELVSWLEEQGYGPVEQREISPSLEDVFIRAIRQAHLGKAS